MTRSQLISKVTKRYYEQHKESVKNPWNKLPQGAKELWKNRVGVIVDLLEDEGYRQY